MELILIFVSWSDCIAGSPILPLNPSPLPHPTFRQASLTFGRTSAIPLGLNTQHGDYVCALTAGLPVSHRYFWNYRKIVKQRWESYLDIAWCCTLALVLQTPHTVFLHVLAWGYHIFALLFVVQIHMFWYKGPSPSRDSSLRELGNKKGKITSRWEAWICWNCSPRLLLNQYV